MKEVKNSVYRSTWVPDGDEDDGPKLYNADDWQHDLIRKTVRVTSERRVAVDVGACVGMATIGLKHYFDKVIAFEADPRNYECLLKNTEFLKDVTCHNYAVSDISGKLVRLYREPGCCGHTTFAGGEEKNAVDVFSITLDDALINTPVDFIKIDVEGMEEFVLRGAAAILMMYKPTILLEISKANWKDFDVIYDFLRLHGYHFIEKYQRDFLFVHASKAKNIIEFLQHERKDRVTTKAFKVT